MTIKFLKFSEISNNLEIRSESSQISSWFLKLHFDSEQSVRVNFEAWRLRKRTGTRAVNRCLNNKVTITVYVTLVIGNVIDTFPIVEKLF